MNFLLKLYLSLSLLISLSACTQSELSDRAQIEAIVSEKLLDPESVRFGDLIISKDGNRACIEYNAKNRFGGYVGQSLAQLRKQYGTWMTDNLEASSFSCSTTGFEISDAEDAAELEAIRVMASAFIKSRNLSEVDAKELAEEGEITIDGKNIDCSDSVSFFKIYMKSIASDNVIQKDSTKDRGKANVLLDYLNKGECPSYGEIAFGDILETKRGGADKGGTEPEPKLGEKIYNSRETEPKLKLGEKIYNSACVACHGTGAAGAPKLGDVAAWAPRIAQGMDTLLANATNGLNAMPPKGLCMTCTNEEIRSTIEYMIKESQ